MCNSRSPIVYHLTRDRWWQYKFWRKHPFTGVWHQLIPVSEKEFAIDVMSRGDEGEILETTIDTSTDLTALLGIAAIDSLSCPATEHAPKWDDVTGFEL